MGGRGDLRLTDVLESADSKAEDEAQIKASEFFDLVTNFNEHVILTLPNNAPDVPESWADDEEEGEEEKPGERAGTLVPVMFATSECSLKVYVRDARSLIDQVTKMSSTVPEITSTGTETSIKTTILHEKVCEWMEGLKQKQHKELKKAFDVFVPPSTAKNSLSKILGVRLNLTIDTRRSTVRAPPIITLEEIAYRHIRNVTRRAPDPDHITQIRQLKRSGESTIKILKKVFDIVDKIPGITGPLTIDDIILHEMRAMW
jgi:hypothetical protein